MKPETDEKLGPWNCKIITLETLNNLNFYLKKRTIRRNESDYSRISVIRSSKGDRNLLRITEFSNK